MAREFVQRYVPNSICKYAKDLVEWLCIGMAMSKFVLVLERTCGF
jgi:hypothetical protein